MMTQKETEFINVLQIAKKILEDLHLYYFLDTGTLLGAVRDHRFIPWDNDIDIGIIGVKREKSELVRLSKFFYKKGFDIRMNKKGFSMYYHTNGILVDLTFYETSETGYEASLEKSGCDYKRMLYYLFFRLNGSIIYKKGRSIKDKFDNSIIKVIRGIKVLIPSGTIAKMGESLKYQCKPVFVPQQYLKDRTEIDFYDIKVMVPEHAEEYLAYRYGKDWNIPNKNYNFITDDQSLQNK